MSDMEACEEKANSKQLVDLAYFLEGIWVGKGNINPLGRAHIENLWKVIKELQRKDR